MTLETMATSASGILATIVTADHFLAKSETIIQNTVGPFLWALITKQPIKAKGVFNMSFSLADIEASIQKIEELANRGMTALDKLVVFSGKAASIIEGFAPAGSELSKVAGEVEQVAPEVEAVIETVQTQTTVN